MKVGSPSNSSRLRLSIIVVIVLMVISSPIVMLVNPALMAAPSSADGSTYAPSTISQGGSDFTAQAALLGPATFRSTDLVSSTAIYEIQFITTTTGVIDKIDIIFPAGTGVALAGIIERVGITGPASITKSGTTVTLDLNTPVNVPAGTFVRLEMVDISNPPNPANYKISVTTKNPSNVPIDGPSLSPAYTIRQVSTGMIANNAVTSPKIADGAVTGNKIAGIQKLLFAQCTLPAGSGSIAAGDTDFIDCSVSGAQIGDVVTGEYLGLSSGTQFSNNLLVVAMRVINVDSVTLFIENTDDVSELDLDNQQFSLIVFRK